MSGVVYFIRAGQRGPIKIGFTRNIERRIRQLQSGSPQPLRVLGTLPGDRATESMLQALHREQRIRGDWFRPSGDLLAVARGDLTSIGSIANLIDKSVAA